MIYSLRRGTYHGMGHGEYRDSIYNGPTTVTRVDPVTNEPLIGDINIPRPESWIEADWGVRANYILLGGAALFLGYVFLTQRKK